MSGVGDKGGRLNVRRLETEAVYSDGGIAPGTPDQITGGVLTVYGAHVDVVRHRGSVVTYGVNDMVLRAALDVGLLDALRSQWWEEIRFRNLGRNATN